MDHTEAARYFYSLQDVFPGRLFQIPDYQRGYAWEKRQWQDLLDDLSLLDDGQQQHFFGTIILHAQGSADSNNHRAYDVVDGQQRLTTVTIYLNELAQALADHDPESALRIRRELVFFQDDLGTPHPRVTLNQSSDEYFRIEVLDLEPGLVQPELRAQQRLRDARDYFHHYLAAEKETRGDAYPQWLRAQIDKLKEQLPVILYAAEQQADASLIFAAMNDRGKPITNLEKIKSYLLYVANKLEANATEALTVEVNRTWRHIYRQLSVTDLSSRANEDQLLRAHWLMAYNPKRKSWKGADSIKAHLDLQTYADAEDELFREIRRYLRTLHAATTAYCDVHRPERDGAFSDMTADESLRQLLKRQGLKLVRVGSIATFLPLLMAVRIRYQDQPKEYLQTLDLCEKFAFRVYRWRGKRSNTGQSRIFRLSNQLYRTGEIDVIQEALANTILHYCDDEQFIQRFRDETVDWYHWAGLRYFLYQYELHLGQEGKVLTWEWLNERQHTLEHVLPQTPDKGGYWRERFPKDAYARYVHDVGNLTLTFFDPGLGNRPFQKVGGRKGKRDFYLDSSFFMERALATEKDWIPEAIERRRERIAEWAIERWRVPEIEAEASVAVGYEEGPTPADYQRLLRRRSVPRGQRQLYKALYDAGEEGITRDELVKVMGRRDRKDLAGVLGALGRRINATAGYGKVKRPGIGMVLTWETSADGKRQGRLQPAMRAALEELDPPWLHTMVT